ncbi:unnamed protein product [Cylindrotheca closterium]|uniref:Helicase-associated domain-containing protein n=1 Tax=Cylindrotheca closterium TaxID=2856 RepID=A0AAD2FZA4_9STRA|nr:unnamed protein product [Cylindrotheca closterium]
MSNTGVVLAKPTPTQPTHTPDAALAQLYPGAYSHEAVSVIMNNKSNFSEWAPEGGFGEEEDPQLHHHPHHHLQHHDSTESYNLDADPLDTDDMDVPLEFQQHHHHHHHLHNEKRPAQDANALDDSPNAKRLRMEDSMLLHMDNNNNMDHNSNGGLLQLPMPSNPGAASANTKKVHNDQWDAMFERLKGYKQAYGNCLVPKRFADDPKLGTWVETQRVQYKRLVRSQDESGRLIVLPNKRLTSERLNKLESVGFAWVAKFVKKSTSSKNKDDDSNSTNSSEPVNLQQQRKQHLNEVQWEEMYHRLVQYKQQYGDCLVPRKFEGDPKLATWVETQRVLWNKEAKSAVAPVEEDAQLKRLTPSRKQRLDALGFVWSLRNKRIEDHWDEMFRQLLDYKKVHGDCLVPSRFESNLRLGKWVETQRYEYSKMQKQKQNQNPNASVAAAPKPADQDVESVSDDSKPKVANPRLTEDRLRRLESVGFEWKVKNKMKRYYDKQWDQMFQRLLQFKEANGHCRVPKRYQADTKLGTWVHTQRIQNRKLLAGKNGPPITEEEVAKLLAGQSSSLTPEENAALRSCAQDKINYRLTEDRRKRLEDMGFVWSARDGEKGADISRGVRNTYDDQWDIMFEKLREYKDKTGNCLVPKRYKDNPKLGTWVDTQRVQYKKLQKILASQTTQNGSIGGSEDRESPIPAGDVGKPLVGRLTNDRIRRLEDLGFVWSLRDDWQKHYEELKDYKAQHGHCNVPARYEKNRRLGIWVSAQRQQYKMVRQLPDANKGRRSTSLTPERIGLLNDLSFTWTIRSRDTFGESWNQRYEDLKEFKRIHGHCNVPSKYAENPELGIWVGTQRTQYRLYMKGRESGNLTTSNMNEDRMRALESLGFSWVQRLSRSDDGSPLDDVLLAAAQATDSMDASAEGMLDVDQMSAMHQFPVENVDQVMGEYVEEL